jgi:hypothetical protein
LLWQLDQPRLKPNLAASTGSRPRAATTKTSQDTTAKGHREPNPRPPARPARTYWSFLGDNALVEGVHFEPDFVGRTHEHSRAHARARPRSSRSEICDPLSGSISDRRPPRILGSAARHGAAAAFFLRLAGSKRPYAERRRRKVLACRSYSHYRTFGAAELNRSAQVALRAVEIFLFAERILDARLIISRPSSRPRLPSLPLAKSTWPLESATARPPHWSRNRPASSMACRHSAYETAIGFWTCSRAGFAEPSSEIG